MLDIGWSELGVVAVVLLLVLGPSDLPKAVKAFREMMTGVRKVRSEFQGHLDELVRESDVKEMFLSEGKDVKAMVADEVGVLKDAWEGEVGGLKETWEGELGESLKEEAGGVKDIASEIKADWEEAMESVPKGRTGEEEVLVAEKQEGEEEVLVAEKREGEDGRE